MKIKILALLLIIIELGNARETLDFDGALVSSSIDSSVERVLTRINEDTNAGAQVHHRETNIFHATQEDGHELVKYFIKNGADVNRADDHGMSPLLIGGANGHLEVIKYLIKKRGRCEPSYE